MKQQVILRLDKDLYADLKAQAEAEGRSFNDWATERLAAGRSKKEPRQEWHKRMIAEGKAIAFEPEGPVPTREELTELMRGTGTAVSEALEWSRGEW